MNNWPAIRRHYRDALPEILAEVVNEWGIDPYAWDCGIMTMTPIEAWLWHDIRIADAVLYPQYPIGGVFVDFANPKARVAIECDGAQWHLDKQKDAQRDAMLAGMGWAVYRITGSACWEPSDPDNGRLATAGRFIQRICEKHGIDRGRLARRGEWMSGADMTEAYLSGLTRRLTDQGYAL